MASNPVFTVGDGVIDIPHEMRNDPRFKRGIRLELVSTTNEIILHPQTSSSLVEEPKGDWRRLRGILKGSGYDPNAELEEERIRELESEAGWTRE